MDVAARHASIDDVDAIVRLLAEGRQPLPEQRGGPAWLAHEAMSEPLAPAVLARIETPDATAVVGTIDGIPLGVMIVSVDRVVPDHHVAVIEELFVVVDARGVGLGEAMMDLVLEWASAAGAEAVDGTALPGDRATKNFFETFGLVARAIRVRRRLEPTPTAP